MVFGILLTGFLSTHFFFSSSENFYYNQSMIKAGELAQTWIDVIHDQKDKRKINQEVKSNVPNGFMIGDDYTYTTTTLGSLAAKEISTNPDFAALMVRLLSEAGLKAGDKLGLTLSGSFPSLAISSLAAIQTLNLDVIMMSSLGSSTFGANQERATWLDMENWLIQEGGMEFKSTIVTRGAENDNGGGLMEEGIEIMQQAVIRNHSELYIPETLIESINYKAEIFKSQEIKLLINIGGNQAAMGGCSHSLSLPNGFHPELRLCNDPDRGIIQELNEVGIPVINLLNIKDMASVYGMDLSPGLRYASSTNLYVDKKPDRIAVIIIWISIGLSIMILLSETIRRFKKNDKINIGGGS